MLCQNSFVSRVTLVEIYTAEMCSVLEIVSNYISCSFHIVVAAVEETVGVFQNATKRCLNSSQLAKMKKSIPDMSLP